MTAWGMAWIYPLKKKNWMLSAVSMNGKLLLRMESGEHIKLFCYRKWGEFTSDSLLFICMAKHMT